MTASILAGALVGFGVLGVVLGLRTVSPSLDRVAAAVDSGTDAALDADLLGQRALRTGRWVSSQIAHSDLLRVRWSSLAPYLSATDVSAELLVTRMLVGGAAGLVAFPALWVVAFAMGVRAPLEPVLLLAVIAVPVGAVLPVILLVKLARERQRHVRIVLGSFVDLVVLSLAGGVGVEGALFAASQVSSDWAAQRIARALSRAQAGGQSPWRALGRLGEELGVPELVEMSNTLQLAGTEGSRIRQSLSARAASLRRHEQAYAESAANSTTERLFVPGALLLIGFVLFIGYPAFSRILGGF